MGVVYTNICVKLKNTIKIISLAFFFMFGSLNQKGQIAMFKTWNRKNKKQQMVLQTFLKLIE